MPDLARLPRLLAALGLCLPLLASAQANAPMTDAERARRDAEKVFSFIKFQTVPAKPAADAPRKPARPPAPPAPAVASHAAPAAATAAPERAITTARPPEAAIPQPSPATRPVASLSGSDTPAAPEPAAMTAPSGVPSLPQPLPQAAAPLPTAPAAAEPETEADDAEDGALQLQNFVAPVLTPAVQATLGPGARNVKVRFTVEADGRVSQAEALANVPRRLAKPAVDAILQWQFAPLPQPRTVDVEIAFRRD